MSKLFIISAPSGAGKTTICTKIVSRFKTLKRSISYTTRKPRQGERDKIDYFFISKETFENGIKIGQWAEWAKVHDYYYGTSADFLNSQILQGKPVLLNIDTQGAKQIMHHYPNDSIGIFIMPPSMEVLKQRLIIRGTDDLNIIMKRLQNAENEIAQRHLYKYTVINDTLDKAVDDVFSIIKQNCSYII